MIAYKTRKKINITIAILTIFVLCTNIFGSEIIKANTSDFYSEILREVENSPELVYPFSEGMEVEALQAAIDDIYEGIAPRMDLVITPLAIKGAICFGLLVYSWANTFYLLNRIGNADTKVTLDSQEWIHENWDEISIYYQNLPSYSQGMFAMMGGYTTPEINEVFPMTASEQVKLDKMGWISKYDGSISPAEMFYQTGVTESAQAIIRRWMNRQPITQSKPNNWNNFYRTFNMNHAYGKGFKIPSSPNEIIPEGVPHGVKYRANLEKYNYGWEYADLSARYYFNALDGDTMFLELNFITRLSPNQQYDGKVYPNITTGTSKQGFIVRLRKGSTDLIAATTYWQDSGTSIPERVRAAMKEHAGFTPNVDDSLWHAWVDIAPFPQNLYLGAAKSISYTAYSNAYTKHGYEFPVISPGFYRSLPSNYFRATVPGKIPLNINDPDFIKEVGFDTYKPTPLPEIDAVMPLPDKVPYPNPIEKPELVPPIITPDPNPDSGLDIPTGFFAKIMTWLDNVWQWISNFFTTLWQGFINAMKSLFIPSDGFFTDKFDKLKDDIGGAFGFSNWQDFEGVSGVSPLRPRFTANIYGKTVDVVDLGFWEDNRKYLQALLNGFMSFLLLLFNWRMILYLIRGSSPINSSGNAHANEKGRGR